MLLKFFKEGNNLVENGNELSKIKIKIKKFTSLQIGMYMF